MDAFSPIQFRRSKRLLRKCSFEGNRITFLGHNWQRDSARRGLIGIAILNCPAAILFQAIKAYPEDFLPQSLVVNTRAGEWLSKITNAANFSDSGRTELVEAATQEWLLKLAFYPQLAVQEPWTWTWITSSFTHTDAISLAIHMVALLGLSPQLLSISGMSTLHIFGITLGSSIVSNCAFIAERTSEQRMFFGAAPIVCGLAGACAAEALWMSHNVPEHQRHSRMFSTPAWFIVARAVCGGIETLFSKSTGSPASSSWFLLDSWAPLAAALFGATYYRAFLRPARPRQFPRQTRRQGGSDSVRGI